MNSTRSQLRVCGALSRVVSVIVTFAATAGGASCSFRPSADPAAPELRFIEGLSVHARILDHGEAVNRGAVQGDVSLQGEAVEVLIGGMGRPAHRGAVLGLRQGETVHDWEALTPLLAIDDRSAPVEVDRVRLVHVGDRPAVAIDGHVAWNQREIRVRRWLRLADVAGVLRITTVVSAGDAGPSRVAVVERVAWGGGLAAAPLHPELVRGVPVTAEWIARTLGRRAAVIGAKSDAIEITPEPLDHGEPGSLRYTDIRLPTHAQAHHEFRSDAVLSLSPDGLAQAARQLGWVRGQPFTELGVTLAAPTPGTQVRVVTADSQAPVVAGYPDAMNRVILPIPPQALTAKLAVIGMAGQRVARGPIPLEGPPYAPVQLTMPTESNLVVRASASAHGGPLPVRIRVKAYPGTPAANLGPDWLASGAIDTVIAASGQATIRLPAGRYRLLVTHGPEWSVFDRDVQLEVGSSTRIEATLERVMERADWVACDFHVHAEPSPDSNVTLVDRVASLVAEGIDLAVPTDHNHVTDYAEAVQAQPLRGLSTVPGVEITTFEPSFGHFNAFPVPVVGDQPGNGAALFERLPPAALFKALRELGSDVVVQVNHPRHPGGIGYFELTGYEAQSGRGGESYSDDYDALELWNGFELAERERVEALLAEWLLMLARGRRVVATAGSDSHTIRTETAGYPRTYVRAPITGLTSARDVIAALKQGRAFVTNGPLLHVRIGAAGPGDEVVLDPEGTELNVAVQSPRWLPLSTLRVYLGGSLLRQATLRQVPDRRDTALSYRYTHTALLRPDATGPLVVVVSGDKPADPLIVRWNMRPLAVSNPVWLSAPPPQPRGDASIQADD